MHHTAIRTAPCLPLAAVAGPAGGGLRRLVAALTLGALGTLAPMQSAAQEAAGGMRLTFGLGLRAETDSNANLDPVSRGRTSRAISDLSFGLASTTRTARFALDAGVSLQGENAPRGRNNGLQNPFAALSYGRDWADANFELSASLRETDLSTDSDVTNFDPLTGIRRVGKIDTALRWGENRPVGFGLSAGYTDTRYRNAPGTPDHTIARVGLTARLDLSQASRLDLGLRGSRYDAVGAPRVRDTLGFDAGLTITRPRGSLGVHLAIDDTEDGQRQSLTLRNDLELPRGRLAYGLGATQGVDDRIRLTGSLDYSLALPRGALAIGLSRSVKADEQDAETVVSSASLSYRHALTPLSSLRFTANWATSRATLTNLDTTNTSLGATYSHELTRDWTLDIGYRHRLRDAAGIGKARSNSVFLGLRREFAVLR